MFITLFNDDWEILLKSVDLAIAEKPPEYYLNFLEIGVLEGFTSLNIVQHLKKNNREFTYYGIDCRRMCDEFFTDPKMKFIEGFSFQVSGMVPDVLDWLFIDSCHCAMCVKRDFELYSGKLKVGGFLCFHDTNAGGQGQDSQDYDELHSYHNRQEAAKGIDVLKGLEMSDLSQFELVLETQPHESSKGGVRVYRKLQKI